MLTPKQFGKAAVQSFPFFVDGNALLDSLLAFEAQPQPGATPASLPQVLLILMEQGIW